MQMADEALIAFLRLRIAAQHVVPELRDGRILRPPQAAMYLGLTEKALWWHRRHRSGPTYVRLGERNALGYIVRDLDAWLLARSVKQENSPRLGGTPKSNAKRLELCRGRDTIRRTEQLQTCS